MSRKLRLVLAATAALCSLLTASATAATTPDIYPLPAAHHVVQEGIAIDSGGNVWFATQGAGSDPPDLDRLNVAQATPGQEIGFDSFPTPLVEGEGCCARLMRDLAYDPKGNRIWFARSRGVVGSAKLGEVSPGSASGITATGIPGFPDLGGLAIGQNDLVWFTESSSYNVSPFPGNRIGYVTQGLGITEFPDLWHQVGAEDSTRYDARPTGIAVDGEGFPWFTEAEAGIPGYRIAKGIPGSPGTYQEHRVAPCAPSPCTGSGVSSGTGVVGIAIAPDGIIWFTNVLKNSVGRFDPVAQTITEYPLTAVDPTLSGGEPRSIRVAQDGSLWVSERGFISHPAANALVRLAPGDPPTATVYPLGSENSPLSLTPDASGNVWFLIGGASSSAIGRLAGVVGGAPPPGEKAKPPPGEVVLRPSGVSSARVEDPRVKGTSVEINQICVGPPEDPCTLVYLLDSHEYVSGLPGTKPRPASASVKRVTRRVVVGSKTVTIPGGKSAKVTIKLNAKGKKILKRDGVLKLTFHASQQVTKGKKKTLKPLKTKKLTIRAPK